MKKLACVFAMVCWLGCSKAQNVWNKIYIEDRPTMLFSSIIRTDTSFMVLGVISDKLAPSYARALIGVLDSNGQFVKYLSINDSIPANIGTFWNNLFQTNDGNYAFTGYLEDSLPRLVLGIVDKNADSVTLFQYSTPNTSAFQGYSLVQYTDNSYFITGVRTDSALNNANIVVLKIDSSGNRIWEKYFNNRFIDYARKILVLNNGNLLLGGVRNDANQVQEHANTWLLEIDTGGRLIRQRFDPNDSTNVAEGLKQTSDGGFIYGAQKKHSQFSSTVYYIGTVVKMNSNFTKQWTFMDGNYNDETGIYDLEELPDGSFIGCGNKPFYKGDSSMISGWVVKLSSTGSVIWNKTYAGLTFPSSSNYLTDIDILTDGSLVSVGQCKNLQQQPPQVGWFLKLDSNGCEIENCLVGIDDNPQTIEIKQLRVYPNPATDIVRFDYNWVEWERIADCELRIADLQGRIMLQQKVPKYSTRQEINIKQLAAGVYTISLSDNASSGAKVIAVCKLVKE